MRILFDQGSPVPLRMHLSDHGVETAYEQGRSKLRNGELLDRAEAEGFELLNSTDQSLCHQQNLAARRSSVPVLMSTSWPRNEERVKQVAAAIERIASGECVEVPI